MENVIDAKKASIIRAYPLETLILILIVSVGFLTGWQYKTSAKVDDLQTEMKNYLHEDRKEGLKALDRNTSVLERIEKKLD